MAWDGWYQFDGSEIINAARTEQYARNLGISWLIPQFKNGDLSVMLGDGSRYRTPLLDDAPWIDENDGASEDFLGLYPLAIDGVESATRTATVVEGLGNGGAVVGVRHGTRTMVFSGALCATSEDGAEYGLRWLKQVLNGAPCDGGPGQCGGGDLCYFISQPALGEQWGTIPGMGYGGGTMTAQACLTDYLRTQQNVTVTSGPTVTAKRVMSDGGSVWTVTFTAVAAKPYEFGSEQPIVSQFMHPTEDPWSENVTGIFTPGAYRVDEEDCQQPVFRAVYDPLCPALIPPPLPATVAMGCFTRPKNWFRRHFTIGEEFVPLWGEVVPRIEINSGDTEVRALRIRFYADPLAEGNPSIDPCGYCGDILISFIPADATLVLDGVEESVYVQYRGAERRRADSLVFASDGTPFDWPVLSCGMGYVVTFDMPQTQKPPLVNLSLTPRVI